MIYVKLSFKDLNKVVKCPESYENLIESFSKAFEKTTEKIRNKSVVYKDAEGDIVSVTNEDDFKILLDYIQKNPDKTLKITLIKKKCLGIFNKCEKAEKRAKNVHKHIQCSNCKTKPILGIRYKCRDCKELDYCEKCFTEKAKEHGHEFIKIETNDQKNVHHFVTCDNCGIKPIVGIRYKCKDCKNFDYCEKCYNDKAKEHNHEFHKIETNDQKDVHHFVVCDGCGIKPIVGIRYKCAICKNFDYCEKCEKSKAEGHGHCFLKLYNNKCFELLKKKWMHMFMKFNKMWGCVPCKPSPFGFPLKPRFGPFGRFPRKFPEMCCPMKCENKCENKDVKENKAKCCKELKDNVCDKEIGLCPKKGKFCQKMKKWGMPHPMFMNAPMFGMPPFRKGFGWHNPDNELFGCPDDNYEYEVPDDVVDVQANDWDNYCPNEGDEFDDDDDSDIDTGKKCRKK